MKPACANCHAARPARGSAFCRVCRGDRAPGIRQANLAAGFMADQIIGELAMHGIELVERRPGLDAKQLLSAILYRNVYEPKKRRVYPAVWFAVGWAIGAALVMWGI